MIGVETPGWQNFYGLKAMAQSAVTHVTQYRREIPVECKARHGGRQSINQKRIEQEICNRNGIYVLARSAEDVRSAIENAQRD